MASIPLQLSLSLPPPPGNSQTRTKPYPPSAPSSSSARLPHPLKSSLLPIPLPRRPTPAAPPPRRTTTTSMSYNPTPATDRLISAAAYFLPFFNGLQYGRFLFAQYPSTLAKAFEPILPFLGLYRSLPYASFVAFFALYLGVVKNPSLSHYVRFNAMQAVVLDVLLVLPLLFQQIFSPGRSGLGFKLLVWSHNAIFVFIVSCFVYSLVCCLLGRTPYLPLVAQAAGRQL